MGWGDAAQVVVRIERLTEARAVPDDERLAGLRLPVNRGPLPFGEKQAVGGEALRPEQRFRDPVAPLDTAVDTHGNPDLEDVAQADALNPYQRRDLCARVQTCIATSRNASKVV